MLRLVICVFDVCLRFHFITLYSLQMRIIFPAANWCVKINIPPWLSQFTRDSGYSLKRIKCFTESLQRSPKLLHEIY
jgi:hypothetical protein